MIKRSSVADLPGASAASFTLVKINEGDELFQVMLTDGNQDLLITTAMGMSIRFNENEARPMGLVAAGVNGIKLKEGDIVIGASVLSGKEEVALVTRMGLAKRVAAADFPLQGRYGQGVISWKLTGDDLLAVQLAGKLSDKGVCHFKKATSKVFTITNAVSRKRAANGGTLFTLKPGDEVIGFTAVDDFADYWEKK